MIPRAWVVVNAVSIYLSADSASFLTIIPEFCSPTDRPTYIGLTNTLLSPVTTIAPLLGGWLASVLGYPPMFTLTAVVAGLGAGLLANQVRDPRIHGQAATIVQPTTAR